MCLCVWFDLRLSVSVDQKTHIDAEEYESIYYAQFYRRQSRQRRQNWHHANCLVWTLVS